MKKSKLILAFFVFFLIKIGTTSAQIDTSFWFACPWVTPDHWWKNDIKFHISSFSAPSTTVHVRQPALASASLICIDTTFVIPANTNVDVALWRKKIANATTLGFDSTEVRPANTVQPYGIYVSTSSSVTIVYDVITRTPNFFNPETFSLKGQNGLGYEFVCPFQTKWRNQTLGGDLNGDGTVTQPKQQLNIVASKPNTVVWITPKCAVIGHPANITYSVMLPFPGSAYTVENAVQNTNVAGNNLSGTIVVANKPISVTVADDSVSGVTGCYDLMGDQIVPTDIVGTDYILNKGYMNAPEHEGAYIVATENFTQLTINDGVTTTTLINKGDTYHYKTTQPLTYVNATKNVYCLHASGTGCELGEALLPPLNCAGSNLVAFSRTNNQGFYLNLLCKNGSQGTFTLNNASGTVTIPITAANFTLVPGTATLAGGPFYGGQLNLTPLATLPIGSYTVYNPTDVFALGVFGGNASTGGLFHYMSSFLKRTDVVAQPSVQICAGPGQTVALTGTVTGGAITGSWSTANGTGVFGAYTSTLNTISVPYVLSNADTLLSSIKFYITATNACGKIFKDSTYLKINQKPQAYVGGNVTKCKNAPSLAIALTGTMSPGTSLAGSWVGGNGGSFAGPGVNTTYNPSPSDLAVGNIVLTLSVAPTFSGCPYATKSITVTFINPPIITAGVDITACTNSQSVTLAGSILSGTCNTVWATNGTGLFIPNNSTTTPVYQFSASDLLLPSVTFTLNSVAVGGGCSGSPDIMQVSIIPKPFVSAPNDFTICASSSAVLLTGTVGASASGGSWSTPTTGIGAGSGAFSPVTPPATQTYSISQNDTISGIVKFYLTTTGGICPSEKDSLLLTIQKAPAITITTNSISVCKNAPIILNVNVTGSNSYTWVPPSTSTGSFAAPGATVATAVYNPSAADIASGPLTFTILVSNPPCSPSQKTVTANFIPSPTALFTIPNLGKCVGASVPITNASLDNGTAPLSYSWNVTNGAASTATNPIFTFTKDSLYTITLIATGGPPNNCPDTIRKTIKIYPLPITNFSVLSGCQGINSIFQNLSIVPGGGGSVTAMSWVFGDSKPNLLTGLTSTVTHLYDNAGPYNAALTVTTNFGCVSNTTIPITVNSQPKAEFGLTNNPAVAQEPIYFSDFSTPTGAISNWLWQFGDETSATDNAPSHSYQAPGVYIIKLTVADANGCTDTISKSIEISLLPQVPTAFSPNGDNNNDLLFVKGGPFQNMIFKVYNNWGELLFETTDQKIGWDGKKNGQNQPVGVYVWTLQVDMYNNRQVKKNGDITLIR